MSNRTVISVENLGKVYRISHQAGGQKYVALRDVLAEKARRLFGPGKQTDKTAATEEFWALKDINFEIKQGDVVGIIGHNGAGKSTLLKILSRITEPSAGRVRIKGRVASLLEVGTGFHPELTGRENIYLNGAILGMSRAEIRRKFDEIVAFAETEKFLDTPVKRYSSGMYVRLAFAVAAHLEPEILIVDEVLAVGDAQFQKKCLGKMENISKSEGRTVLFVSHNIQAVTSLCRRAILLDQGRMIESGPAGEVITKYISRQTEVASSDREKIWIDRAGAPGNDQVRIRSIRLLAETDQPLQQLHVDTPFRIQVEYWNLQPGMKLGLDLFVSSVSGGYVFEDWSVEEAAWGLREFPVGYFQTICRIPGDLLNEGTFQITLMFFDGETVRELFTLENAVMFTVTDIAKRPLDWHGTFAGVVRPKLAWETKLLPDGADQNNAGVVGRGIFTGKIHGTPKTNS